MNRRSVGALAAGLLFGAGLVVSGMTDPRNVIGFLDFFGKWDPSLMFVTDLAVAPNGDVFVGDVYHGMRVQKFSKR